LNSPRIRDVSERVRLALGIFVLSGSLLAVSAVAELANTEATAQESTPSFERAQSMRAADPLAAASMLDGLARLGDVRAQMLLGAMLIEGKEVPRNGPLGLAFLQVAAAQSEWMFGGNTSNQVEALVQRYQLAMTGQELLEADRLARDITMETDREKLAELRPALQRYTDEQAVRARPNIAFEKEPVQIAEPTPVADGQLMGFGCARERGPGCVGVTAVNTPGLCSGRLMVSDTPPNSRGEGARVPPPVYPVSLRRAGKDGTVVLLAHIDSSGWVCSTIVSRSAGDARLDAAALETVRQWRFVPATKGGVPVEALTSFQVTFRLNK
jgi:TonB family protein